MINSRTFTRPLNRALATAQNGLEVLRLGGLDGESEPTPFVEVEKRPMYRLRRYFPDAVNMIDDVSDRPPVLLIPPMMMAANVFDVTREKGGVGVLFDQGIDPWVIDFGSPDREAGGLARNLADHIVAVSQAVDQVREHTGRDVHLSGYSQGGMFAYQAAAYRQSEGLASVITFGSPVDTLAALPFGLPAGLASRSADFLADHIISRLYLPAWGARIGFQLLDPVKTAKSRLDFVRQLHDRDALIPREAQRRFLESDGYVAYSGPAIAELLKQFIAHNRMMTGGFVIEGKLVSLAEITCPVLAFIGEVDDIGQPVAVRGIVQAAPKANVYERILPSGHFGLVVGSTAGTLTWPSTAEWMHWQEAVRVGNVAAARPEAIHPMEPADVDSEEETGVSVASRLTHGVNTIAEVGVGATRSIVGFAVGVTRSTVAIAEEAARTLPRLARLGEMQSHTRVSLGQLMEEQAQRSPDSECFLYEGRVHTNRAVHERINNVVRGLVHLGIRQGAEVGVLMETRPSALVAIAALSRLGAIAVLLPAGSAMHDAIAQSDVVGIITDPDHLDTATGSGRPVIVLGGGNGDREFAERDGVIDMELIDPAEVRMPKWYEPNPGRARDLAFIMFSGTNGRADVRRITNRRWALSAFGTASAAALDSGDTVYCLTPLNHPSGLLTSVGGAVAGGSRIALTGKFDPERFATEVRRYGVTVVSYTWAQLSAIIDDPEFSLAKHHPIRLFIGSGMPLGLWERVTDKFRPARVVEFYASTEGGAVLANLSPNKAGAKGRPMPGSALIKLAAYDALEDRYLEQSDGLVREAQTGEVGRLVARARADMDYSPVIMRGLFEQGDAWVATSDLFYKDEDGDYWMVDTIQSVVRSDHGLVFTLPISDAAGRLSEVCSAVTYGVTDGGAEHAILAVTVVEGKTLTPGGLDEALVLLPVEKRPALVRVVDEIPTSRWFRPITAGLVEQGLPDAGSGAFGLDRASGHYRNLTPELLAQIRG